MRVTTLRWRHFLDHIGSSLEMTVYTYFPNLMFQFCSRLSMHRIWNWIKYGQKNEWKSLCSVWNALPTFTITRYYSCCNRRRVRHIAEYLNRKCKIEWMKFCLIYQILTNSILKYWIPAFFMSKIRNYCNIAYTNQFFKYNRFY